MAVRDEIDAPRVVHNSVKGMVARGGIEPPTRGFSVAGTVARAARKSKARHSLAAGVGTPRSRPNWNRPAATRDLVPWSH